MIQINHVPLTEDEFAAPIKLGRWSARGTIVPMMANRLKSLGYANEIMETLILTEKGSARILAGNL